jgi:hypothetical protein
MINSSPGLRAMLKDQDISFTALSEPVKPTKITMEILDEDNSPEEIEAAMLEAEQSAKIAEGKVRNS